MQAHGAPMCVCVCGRAPLISFPILSATFAERTSHGVPPLLQFQPTACAMALRPCPLRRGPKVRGCGVLQMALCRTGPSRPDCSYLGRTLADATVQRLNAGGSASPLHAPPAVGACGVGPARAWPHTPPSCVPHGQHHHHHCGATCWWRSHGAGSGCAVRCGAARPAGRTKGEVFMVRLGMGVRLGARSPSLPWSCAPREPSPPLARRRCQQARLPCG